MKIRMSYSSLFNKQITSKVIITQIKGRSKRMISDAALNSYYARDYYGSGTDYFDPPEWTDDDLEEMWEDE